MEAIIERIVEKCIQSELIEESQRDWMTYLLQRKFMNFGGFFIKSMQLTCLTDIAEICANSLSQYDILFLDIDLGSKSGIDLARQMRKLNPEAVLIFVTNFSEYAPEGYEVDAFRYLSKSEIEKKLPAYFEDALTVSRTRQRKIDILCEGESVPVPVQALAWIESQGHEQCLHLVGSRREQLLTRLTMMQLEELLAPQGFLRIRQSERILLINSHNAAIDAVLNQKGYAGNKMGIDMRFRVNDLSELKIPRVDLTIVLANLIDNAMEACVSLSEQSRWVSIQILYSKNVLSIRIINPSKSVQINNGYIPTTKPEPLLHGFGISNVSDISEKYNAEYFFNYEDG